MKKIILSLCILASTMCNISYSSCNSSDKYCVPEPTETIMANEVTLITTKLRDALSQQTINSLLQPIVKQKASDRTEQKEKTEQKLLPQKNTGNDKSKEPDAYQLSLQIARRLDPILTNQALILVNAWKQQIPRSSFKFTKQNLLHIVDDEIAKQKTSIIDPKHDRRILNKKIRSKYGVIGQKQL